MANWANRTLWTGDNLDVMRGMDGSSVDLIYLDPPFNSNATYKAPIGSKAAGAAFKDTWTLDDVDLAWHGEVAEREPALYKAIEASRHSYGKGMMSYLIMMSVRLLEMKRILKPTGSIYLHIDPTASHYLKATMDCVFGRNAFRNEIVWCYSGGGVPKKDFPRKHDVILRYGGARRTFNMERKAYKENTQQVGKHSTWSGGSAIDLDRGTPVTDWWVDIKTVTGWSPEKTGYPTQKPLALLDRIIKASSNEGDIVFDPFCGCATTLVSAERLGRQWVGCDLSSRAVELVRERLLAEMGIFFDVHHRTDYMDPASRVDIEAERAKPYNHVDNKRHLFGVQEGSCRGCGGAFEFRHFEVDHIVPRAEGGGDELDNLQLLCGACNRAKGARSDDAFGDAGIAELEARLARMKAARAGRGGARGIGASGGRDRRGRGE